MTAEPTERSNVKAPKFSDAEGLLRFLFQKTKFFTARNGEAPVIPHVWVKGQNNMVLVVGENATGKSLMRRVVCQAARQAGHEPMPVSMQGRTMPDWSRAFVYGDESSKSTGQISIHTVITGIRTCKSRANTHIVFWDEPDLGLSDSWSAGVGIALREFANDMPANTVAAFVVTHNKVLVRRLAAANPHYVALGASAPPSVEAWLAHEPLPRDIAELGKESHELFLQIHRLTKGNQ
jgi:hypothetical protein